MKNEAEKILYCITEEQVQMRALTSIERELSQEELEKVRDQIYEDFWRVDELIDEAIEEVVSFDDLLVRNSCAETAPVHYLLYWKNKNVFQKEYQLVFATFTEDDAREYIDKTRQEYDQHKIVLMNDGIEKVIEEMGEEYPGSGNPPSKEDWALIDKNMKS
jgi:hypothetical protein